MIDPKLTDELHRVCDGILAKNPRPKPKAIDPTRKQMQDHRASMPNKHPRSSMNYYPKD
jgi:hypothetical protein